jgi:hypothetical protein
MASEDCYVARKIENSDFPGIVQINLAENLEDVALLLLVSLMAAQKYPDSISEAEVHREITDLADAGKWDELAFKGLKWIQEIGQ